jgi:uncharacterized protein (TIGR02145 family)
MIGGVPTWIGGTPPPVTVTIGGNVWMDRNLGASQAATSLTDALAYGNLYQWGRGNDGHELRTNASTTSTLSTTDSPGHGDYILNSGDWRSPSNDNLWQGVNGVNNPCPSGFRVPTVVEISGAALDPSFGIANGGMSLSDESAWGAGTHAIYWTSDFSGTTDASATSIYLGTAIGTLIRPRGWAAAIRCIQD